MLHPIFLFLNIGSSEMILIMFVALMLFGGDKLPQLAKGLGKGIRDFKDASEGVKRELHNQINNFEEKTTPAPEALVVDPNAPVVEGTTPVADPFAVPAVVEHVAETETPAAADHVTITEHNTEGEPRGFAAVSPTHANADVSHLITEHTEVNQVAENHITLSHVSDEAKAGEEPVANNSTK